MKKLLKQDGWLLAFPVAIFLLCLAGCEGCTTSQKATAFKALYITATSVDAGMKAFADAVVAGKVPDATQAKVRDLHTRYSKAMQAAIAAAQFDTSQPTPANVTALATELLMLITEATKGTP